MKHHGSFRLYTGFALLAILALQLAGCASPEPSPRPDDSDQPGLQPPPIADAPASKVLQSEIPRDISPEVPSVDLQGQVAGNSAFALDFYQAVRHQGGNLFYSPFSLSVALAMTYAGARENTAAQMADTLHFTLPQDRLHPAFNALDLELTRRDEGGSGDEELQPFQLSVANSLWAHLDYPFLPEFMDLLARNYGAGLRLVDFVNVPEAARQTINDWVSQETHEKIKDLIPEGAINDMTRLVLANAIYFKADWMHTFGKEFTREEPFNLLDGGQVNVPMMSYDDPKSLPYTSGDGFQAVELPYVGDTTSMVILVPDAGNFAEFEANLDAAQVDAILAGLEPHTVALTLPKFSFESDYDLKGTLAEMGMPEAFDPELADLSGMDGTHLLYIGDVFHKAFVAVDEKGTEAAAATAVIIQLESEMLSDVQLIVDRPFIFIIRDKPTGTILFLGRVLNPLE